MIIRCNNYTSKQTGPKQDSENRLRSPVYAYGRRTLVLIIIALFRNCEYLYQIYLIYTFLLSQLPEVD
jgi:hypothetical protein